MGGGYHMREQVGNWLLGNRLRRLGLAAAATAVLTACGSGGISNPFARGDEAGDGQSSQGPAACPTVLIVQDAAELTLFAPTGGRDLTDVVATATFGPFQGQCDYFDDRVDVRLTLFVVGERGPALQSDRVVVEYFVSILDPEDRITVKREFPVELRFAGPSLSQTASREVLAQSIPLTDQALGSGYEILIGYQLNPDQLEFNRR